MTTPNPIGSLGWARRGGGRLTPAERFAFARATVAATLALDLGRLLRRIGLGQPRQVSLVLGEVPRPNSAVAQAAEALCAEVSTPSLANHCHRTYLWGALLAARDGLAFDAELAYVASLLHDLGLTERFGRQDETACFAHAGAEAALRFTHQQGWPLDRAERLADAICRHLNPRVAVAEGAEAHLLRQGAGLDVVGQRLGDIAAPTRDEVLRRHPRLGQNSALAATMADEARRHPGGRLFQLCQLGFLGRIRRAPLEG